MSRRISTVAAELGVAPVTLRAWERRYGFPRPERTDGNYRTYSDAEVQTLRRVISLMGHGLTVSEAMARVQGTTAAAPVDPAALVERCFAAAAALDERALNDLLQVAIDELPPDRACDEVLMPILRGLTDRLDIAREHLASRAVRHALAQLATDARRTANRRPLLLACPDGEQHEGGLLSIAVHLRLLGEHVVVLGANTPTEALVAASKRLTPVALLLSLIRPRSGDELGALIRDIVKRCKVPIVIVGGSSARAHLKSVFAAGAEFAETAKEVVAKLKEKTS